MANLRGGFQSFVRVISNTTPLVLPEGTHGWSLTVSSGTVIVTDSGGTTSAIGVGQTVGGGGYDGKFLVGTLTLTGVGGVSALVEYDVAA